MTGEDAGFSQLLKVNKFVYISYVNACFTWEPAYDHMHQVVFKLYCSHVITYIHVLATMDLTHT